ncbi:ABC transporter ATP-binding protein [Streptomyces sp. NPDC045470]|uniref:ABC transporter ATP-binding protein n=1 Tax=Streptomyces sp. NPDC045470 TaxID=3155469 RepID=UPI0033FCE4C5
MFAGQGSGIMLATYDDPGNSTASQRLRPGTLRRILAYAKPHSRESVLLLLLTVVDSLIIVSTPLLLKEIIDVGILQKDTTVLTVISLVVAGLALLDAGLQLAQSWYSGRISQGVSYDLRVQAFTHVQRQPLAFFTRTQTGSLVSRLNTDVVGAQHALGTLLGSLSSVFTLVLVLGSMFYLSWLVSLVALVILPVFMIPGALVGRRLTRYSREQMQMNAEMGATIGERFNVAGAMLSKLFGRPHEEARLFAERAGKVREVGVTWMVLSRLTVIIMTLLAAVVTALVYGLGGAMVVDGTFQVGTLVALAALLARLYGPITQLSSIQGEAHTAMVSFDRIFELLDLKPLITERENATDLPAPDDGAAPEITFDGVSFRYPKASEVSLASLESHALPADERSQESPEVLCDISFTAPSGKLTALVGPSGVGKTTATHLVSRLYDPSAGSVRIAGQDLRDVTLDSLRRTVGVVSQDAHLFHDTIRNNLTYARPGATEEELIEACRAAQIWDTISSLPSGLDTVAGDRGYRLSGGEKQRLALARLLLKAPSIVVLDEATAHLDSESEAAVQRALKTALHGRTSVVIAHRLSTIREADQILVFDEGGIRERGTHEELLAAGGLYAELYHTQFARQAVNGSGPEPAGPGSEEERSPQEAAPQMMPGGMVFFDGSGPGDGGGAPGGGVWHTNGPGPGGR